MLVAVGTAVDVFAEAKAGDRNAFSALVHKHQSMVFSIALHSLRDAALAEELAQEVFLDLYQHLGDLQSSKHAEFWLRQVTSRRCIDYARKRKRQPSVGLEDAPEPSSTPQVSDPYLSDTLRKLTASLPEKARMVVLLRYQEDLAPAEIAETLDIPLNSVKSCLHRALAMLREKLERAQIRR
jgi:RNA polymerase sigma-70 factor (ECF subfamily)